MPLMKATKSFLGQPGEGPNGIGNFVRRGNEFRVAKESRATALEMRGLGYRIEEISHVPPEVPKGDSLSAPFGDAAPLGSQTGEAPAQSSSLVGQARPAPGSKKRKANRSAS